MGKNSISVHSAAGDIGGGFNVGGGSQPSAPSVHPNYNIGANGSDSPEGAGFGDKADQTAVSVQEVQFATGLPESYSGAGLGDTLVGGLGTPPKA
jgi:hypothetical protein